MNRTRIKIFLAGLFIAAPLAAQGFAQTPETRPADESERIIAKASAPMTDWERLQRAEDRAEELRTKLLAVQVRELDLQFRIDTLDFRMTPEGIRLALAFEGSVKPMDELRHQLRVSLEAQKAAATRIAEGVAAIREQLAESLRETEVEVERIRQRMRPVTAGQ